MTRKAFRREAAGLTAGRVERDPRIFEFILLGLIAAALFSCLIAFARTGYLPPPFFYNSDDTFMDWFNTAYWANNGGEYTAWISIYPPVSFAFLRLTSLSSCYTYDPILGRDCDWLSHALIVAFFLINLLVSYVCFRVRDKATALVRALALGFGLPMLYALERGNLCLVAFGCFGLAWADVLRSPKSRCLALAMAVNLKPYLAITLATYLVKRRWADFDWCVWAILLVWLVSFIIVGSGTPGQVVLNQVLWLLVSGARAFYEPVQNATSYSSLLTYLHHAGEARRMIGDGPVMALSFGLQTFRGAAGLCATIILIWTAVARVEVPIYRLAALTLSLAFTVIDPGGYTLIFLIFLIFLEKWERPTIIVALVAAFLLCVPFDASLLHVGRWSRFSYLGDRRVEMPLSIGVSALIRPSLVIMIQIALTASIYGDIRRARPKRKATGDVQAVAR